MQFKICSKCKTKKNIKEFKKDKTKKDGFYSSCKKCVNVFSKTYYLKNKERIDEYNKNWAIKNEEKRKKYFKEYCFKNKDLIHKYYQDNKERINFQRKNYIYERRNSDILFRFKSRIRTLIYMSLKKVNYSKKSKTYKILGISYKDCLDYLFENAKLRYPDFEPKDFLEKNKYHIDHIIPLAEAKIEEDIIRLCNFTNLQLLTKEDNLAKSYKIEGENNE